MEVFVSRLIEAVILPPGVVVLVAVAGLLLLTRRKALGATLLLLSVLALYAFSTPIVATGLMKSLERYQALATLHVPDEQPAAIVVLGGGRYADSPEYGGDTVSDETLVRLRYAARLHRQSGYPVLLTGGSVAAGGEPEARLMQRTLRDDFGIEAKWIEVRSRTTAENAFYSKVLLAEAGISQIFLVTHSWHMPRAVNIFSRAGFEVTPAPTAFTTVGRRGAFGVLNWLPDAKALHTTRRAMHEIVGMWWYRIRHR